MSRPRVKGMREWKRIRKGGRSIWIAAAIGAVLFAGATDGSAADHRYVGFKDCAKCHKKELLGDQVAEWQKSRHSQAYKTLGGEKAAELAKKKGVAGPPNEAEQCLKCHVTAYGVDPSLLPKKPLKRSNGVQCQSCHGPGNDYKKKKVHSDHDKSVAAGLWEPGDDEKICTTCHNDESPSWDPAAGFDFEEAKQEIAHPIPEDVKGHYNEIVERLKAEKAASGGK